MSSKEATFTYKVTKGFTSHVMSDREFDAIVELFRYIENNGNDEQIKLMDSQLERYFHKAAYVFDSHHVPLYGEPVYKFYLLASTSDELVPYVAKIIDAAVITRMKENEFYNEDKIILDEYFDTKVHQILDLLESKNVFHLNGFYKVCKYLFNNENIMFSSYFKNYIKSLRYTNKGVNNILNLVYGENISFAESNSEYEED